MTRGVLVLIAALLLAVQIVRNSAVAALAVESSDKAARVWRAHPDSEIALAMTEIGRAARDRRAVPPAVFAMIDDAARKAPLAPEPFLVRGVQAQLAGNGALSTEAFSAAERRDPRSLPAHYFLADAFVRSGDARRGLEEVGTLARLAPNGVASVAPYVAAYDRDRSTWPQLRGLFRSNPDLENAALTVMARDATNADAIMALADSGHRDADAPWLPALLGSLVNAGQYAKARATWASVSGARNAPDQAVYDPSFADTKAPPPFNWTLMSSTVGLAERQPGGRLHVIFYGREDGLLARQLLVLAPGHYRVTMGVQGNVAQGRALTWSIRCDGSQTPFSALPLDVLASRAWTFTVPPACSAQWLELSGVSSDVARQSEVTISRLSLAAERPNG